MTQKVQVKDFIERLGRLVEKRMSEQDVVSLHAIKNVRQQKRPPTILVIEDDEQIQSSLKRLFERSAYRVLAAHSAIELLGAMDDTSIDLVILDIGLPWINGYEIARMMKEHHQLRKIPIVFLSGQNEPDAMIKGFKVGAHDYISKPFDLPQVKKTVDVLLELNS